MGCRGERLGFVKPPEPVSVIWVSGDEASPGPRQGWGGAGGADEVGGR